MKIVIVSPGRSNLDQWRNALLESSPDLEVEVYPEDTDPDETEFILTWNPPEGVFEHYPNLKVISSMGAGINHILKHSDLPKDAVITKVNDQNLKQDLSVFVLTLVLDHLRNMPLYFHQKQQKVWTPSGYSRPRDKTVGIIGVGAIGQEIGKVLVKNGFEVKGWSRSEKQLDSIECFHGSDQFNEFLSHCEIAICTLPLTNETSGILDNKLFSKLPDGAYLINVGRGAHLVENDLWEALDSGKLSGAALDVFDEEPLPEDHPFWEHPKISITPHTASITDPVSISKTVAQNAKRLQRREKLLDTISVEKGY
jgi:glyoxylate/hydroxypyruvate reductase A